MKQPLALLLCFLLMTLPLAGCLGGGEKPPEDSLAGVPDQVHLDM